MMEHVMEHGTPKNSKFCFVAGTKVEAIFQMYCVPKTFFEFSFVFVVPVYHLVSQQWSKLGSSR